ncbi:hypothetical protein CAUPRSCDRAFT_11562 [Caulochytrium protostelioides]|uniref:Uncharacterized protein n=1 Tax=Caulochytrium protostelioides TaxID=1555241 RepID=A0A4P9WWK8_9FUNG|nr:hypothetical protein CAUPRSCDRAFT_11562 [Caulochytrium protostelioides]
MAAAVAVAVAVAAVVAVVLTAAPDPAMRVVLRRAAPENDENVARIRSELVRASSEALAAAEPGVGAAAADGDSGEAPLRGEVPSTIVEAETEVVLTMTDLAGRKEFNEAGLAHRCGHDTADGMQGRTDLGTNDQARTLVIAWWHAWLNRIKTSTSLTRWLH